MKVQIICGFLGAGKTTLLKNLLKQYSADTAVLVNEFGELGVDGALISEGNNFNVVEMPSGCICCSLRESLVDAVREIMEQYAPKQLIIEPSGVASPSSIILGLENADYRDRLELVPVIGIVDMVFFAEMEGEDSIGNFFTDQILNSDIILLNKSDLVSPETQEECRKKIQAINPAAMIIPTVYCQAEIPQTAVRGEVKHFHYSPQFNASVFTLTGTVDKAAINELLESLDSKKYGNIFRAKGIINTREGTLAFDYVHGLINFGQLTGSYENRFVFIGQDVDRPGLEEVIRGGMADEPRN